MALHQILPAAIAYTKALCDSALAKKQLGILPETESDLISKLSAATDNAYKTTQELKAALSAVPKNREDAVNYYHDVIVVKMQLLRHDADFLEQLTDKKYWPYPTYSDLLYY